MLLRDAEVASTAGDRFVTCRCLANISHIPNVLSATQVSYLHRPGDNFEVLRGGIGYCSFPEVREACHWRLGSEEEEVLHCP